MKFYNQFYYPNFKIMVALPELQNCSISNENYLDDVLYQYDSGH